MFPVSWVCRNSRNGRLGLRKDGVQRLAQKRRLNEGVRGVLPGRHTVGTRVIYVHTPYVYRN